MTIAIDRPKPPKLAFNQIELAEAIGVSDRTLRRWARSGILIPEKIGGVRIYPRSRIAHLLKEDQANGNPQL